jgi:hypothetical protein
MQVLRRAFRDLPTVIFSSLALLSVVVGWVLSITPLIPGQQYVGPIAASVCFVMLVAAQIRYWGGVPDLKILDPESTDLEIAGKPTTLWRIPVLNVGSPENVTVKLTLLHPNPGMKTAGGTLHRTGDNPPDALSYATHYWLGRNETQRYDLVAVIESWRRKQPEIISTARIETVSVSGTGVVTTTTSDDMEQAFYYAFQLIEYERHWAQVGLQGKYTVTVTAYAGNHSATRTFDLQAQPNTGSLSVL